MQVHEAEKFPNKFNQKRTSPRYIIIKLSKIRQIENYESQEKTKNKKNLNHHIHENTHKTVGGFLS